MPDYIGSYGIFKYEFENYFAFSNSFLRLVEFLSTSNKPITINKDFSNYYLATGIAPQIPDETLINEIKILPRNQIVHINKKNSTVHIEEIDFEENTIDIDSEEGIHILDTWYYKWTNVLRDIRKKTNLMSFDLSGGFDSRIVSALWIPSNINLDNIKINSGTKKIYNEDFEIASAIAKHFNFKLNNGKASKLYEPLTIAESINNVEYVELGFHKQRYFRIFTSKTMSYRISGHCGGLIRNHPNLNLEEYGEALLKKSERYKQDCYDSTKSIIKRKFDEFSSRYDFDDSKRLSSQIYRETRNRHHFGKEFIESYLHNHIILAPLNDPDLAKLKPTSDNYDDDLLLFAVIFLRYCPDLLNFKIQGKREIKKETLDYASRINNKFPFKPMDFEYIKGPELDNNLEQSNPIIQPGQIDEIFRSIFYSKNFIKEFEKYYSKKTYEKIRKTLEYRQSNPFENVYASIDILKIHEYVKINKTINCNSIGDWLNAYEPKNSKENEIELENKSQIDKLLKKYHTLRIDIKNHGLDTNNVEIIEKSDENATESMPNWISKSNGIGHIIKTTTPHFNMKFKIINDGTLKIRLRGENVTDKNGKRFPVYIDCKKFEVNGKQIFGENTLICHDEPYIFEKDVSNEDIVTITIDWLPFNEKSTFKTKKSDALKNNQTNHDNLITKIKKTFD